MWHVKVGQLEEASSLRRARAKAATSVHEQDFIPAAQTTLLVQHVPRLVRTHGSLSPSCPWNIPVLKPEGQEIFPTLTVSCSIAPVETQGLSHISLTVVSMKTSRMSRPMCKLLFSPPPPQRAPSHHQRRHTTTVPFTASTPMTEECMLQTQDPGAPSFHPLGLDPGADGSEAALVVTNPVFIFSTSHPEGKPVQAQLDGIKHREVIPSPVESTGGPRPGTLDKRSRHANFGTPSAMAAEYIFLLA